MHFNFISAAAHGHVNPTLPLVEELTARGHRVSYATHESFASTVESAGATLIPLPGEPPRPPGKWDPDAMIAMMERSIASARESLPLLVDRLRRDPPLAVCYDMIAFIGSMVAEKLGVPGISLNATHARNEEFSLRTEIGPGHFDNYPGLREGFQRMHDLRADLAAENGVSAPGFFEGPVESLNIVFLPREFQLGADTFDDRFHFVGPSVGRRANDTGWTPPDSDRPLLFISLGTTFTEQPGFFRTCLKAFGDSEWQVAMAIGERVDEAELGELPDNVEVRRYFPQPVVLQHAQMFLSHAGMNSTMESLYYGVPLVAVPQMAEQGANARQVAELGVGRHLEPADVTAELLRSTVDEVSSDQDIRAKVDAMRRVIHEAGGPVAAADAIEAHLSG